MSSLTAPTAATLLPLAFEHDGPGLPTFTSLLGDRKGTTIEAKRADERTRTADLESHYEFAAVHASLS
jgi:hypothetical protein